MKLEVEEIEKIIKMTKQGNKINEIAKKFFVSEKTMRTTLYKYGYRYNKRLELWVNKNIHEDSVYIMQNCDVEYEIEQLSKVRYYDRYEKLYPDGIHIEEKKELEIHKGIYGEIEKLSYEYGADSPSELIELILLRFLDKNRKKDLTFNFRKKWFLENGYDETEVEILMKYNDEEHTPAVADVAFWEDDNRPETEELNEFYIKELEKSKIDISDMKDKIKIGVKSWKDEDVNEFAYLKGKYDDMKRRV